MRRECLDALLEAILDPKARRNVVIAYVRDKASASALLHVKLNHVNHAGEWERFDFRPLSRKGQEAVKEILRSPNVSAYERILKLLASHARGSH